jgi:hypothetical protein
MAGCLGFRSNEVAHASLLPGNDIPPATPRPLREMTAEVDEAFGARKKNCAAIHRVP